jgi:hypothetical protein
MRVKILIFAEEIKVFLRDDLIKFLRHNLVHMEPLLVKAEKYQLKKHILVMERNDLEMMYRM